MKKFVALILLFLGNNIYAEDIKYEIGTGVTRFEARENMFWYQDGFPYHLTLNSPSISLGVKGKVTDYMYWRFGYAYLGTAMSDAVALSSDPEYDRWRADGRPEDHSSYGYLGHWKGHGNVQGLYASILPQYSVNEHVKLMLEAGAYAYKATWHVDVTEWQACSTCPLQNISVKHKDKLKVEPFYGVGIKYDSYNFMFNIYPSDTGGDEFPSVYGNTVMNFSIRKEW